MAGKRSCSFGSASTRYHVVLVAGGVFFCLTPRAHAVGDVGDPELRLSTELASVASPSQVIFKDSPDLEPRLVASPELSPVGRPGMPFRDPGPPFPRAPLPVQVAQALSGQRGSGRQSASGSFGGATTGLLPPRNPNGPEATGMVEADGRSEDPAGGEMPVPAPAAGNSPREGASSVRGNAFNLSAASEQEPDGGTTWVIPPIRWGGSVGYTAYRNSSANGSGQQGRMLTGNLLGSSYIYAPWLARVSGNLGIITGVDSFHSANDQGGGGSNGPQGNSSLVGSGNLDLFSQSRFPFSATFSRSDSRTMNEAVANNFTNTQFGLRQSYRTEDSQRYAFGTFDHSTIAAGGMPADTVNALSGSFNTPLGPFSNNFNAQFSDSERGGTGESATLLSVNTSHTLSPMDRFSFQAYSNFTDNSFTTFNNGIANQTQGRFLQLGSSATWQPEFEDDDDLPLTLTGSLNYLDAQSSGGFGAAQSRATTGTVSAFYRFSPNLTANAADSVNYISSGDGQTRVLNILTNGITYMGTPLMFGKFSYNWNTGATTNWQTSSGSDTPSSMFATVQASHSLARTFIVSDNESVMVNLAQSASVYESQSIGRSTSLSNSGGSTYAFKRGERFTGSIGAILSDVQTQGAQSQHYDSLDVTFSGVGQLSQHSSANVNMTFDWSDQRTQSTFDTLGQQTSTQRMNVMGSASYTHTRFAGVPGLIYNSTYSANSNLRDERMLGNTSAPVQPVLYSLVNRLNYHIGRLDLQLSATVMNQDGAKNALLFFQVNRQIGAY